MVYQQVPIGDKTFEVRCTEPLLGEITAIAGEVLDAFADGKVDPAEIIRHLPAFVAVAVKDMDQDKASKLTASEALGLVPAIIKWVKTINVDALVDMLKNSLSLVGDLKEVSRLARESSQESASSTDGSQIKPED